MIDVWHIAIPVRNLAKSVNFYTKGLSFELIGYHCEGERSQAFVKLPNKAFTIELFEPLENSEKYLSQKPYHIAFECEDLDKFASELKTKESFESLSEVAVFENGVKYLSIKDPDNVSLEFFQGRKIFDRSIEHTTAT